MKSLYRIDAEIVNRVYRRYLFGDECDGFDTFGTFCETVKLRGPLPVRVQLWCYEKKRRRWYLAEEYLDGRRVSTGGDCIEELP